MNVYPTLIGLAFPVVKRPIWSTLIETATGGQEYRTSLWPYPLYEFDLVYDYLTLTDYGNLEGFFSQQAGAGTAFWFDRPGDDAVTAQGIGTGDGTNKVFTLLKPVGTLFSEPIGAPNGVKSTTTGPGLYVIYDNGVAVATANYTVSGNVVTFVTAPAAGHAITWTGAFYYVCRFLDDKTDFSQFMSNLLENRKVTLRTAR